MLEAEMEGVSDPVSEGVPHPVLIESTRCMLDATDHTALWQCTLCHDLSIHLTVDEAEQAARTHHTRIHPKEPTWPRQQPRCIYTGCDQPSRRNQLCNSHSIAAHRATRKHTA